MRVLAFAARLEIPNETYGGVYRTIEELPTYGNIYLFYGDEDKTPWTIAVYALEERDMKVIQERFPEGHLTPARPYTEPGPTPQWLLDLAKKNKDV
jgi:hypothetical protein